MKNAPDVCPYCHALIVERGMGLKYPDSFDQSTPCCGEVTYTQSGARFSCTRDKGHDGPHVACGLYGHNLFEWGSMDKDYRVIAGNMQQAFDYCRSHGFSPIKIVNNPDHLRGLADIRVILVGTYFDRHDWRRFRDIIYERVASRDFEIIKDGDKVDDIVELIHRLEQYNSWRRGFDSVLPDPVQVGKDTSHAIDILREHIEDGK